MNENIIELLDGPLAGTIHEVAGGFLAPDKFSLPDWNVCHWYITNFETIPMTDKFEKTVVNPQRAPLIDLSDTIEFNDGMDD